MNCFTCQGKTRIIDRVDELETIRRTRQCVACGMTFNTCEVLSKFWILDERARANIKAANRGPWLPISEWRKWLEEILESRYCGDRVAMANALGISPRRVSAWFGTKQKWVTLSIVEDCLWKFDSELEWSDLWTEDQIRTKINISQFKKNRRPKR